MATTYESSMLLQRALDESDEPRGIKQQVAEMKLAGINARRTPALERIAHAFCAYFAADGLTMDSFLNPSQRFGEVVLKGDVPRVACIDVDERLVVALPFYQPTVLGPRHEVEAELVDYELENCDTVLPLDTPLRRPLYVPVESLHFITLAAR